MDQRSSTKKGPRNVKTYTNEQRREAIERFDNGETKAQVAKKLNIPEATLRGWIKGKEKFLAKLNGGASVSSGGSSPKSASTDETDEECNGLVSYPSVKVLLRMRRPKTSYSEDDRIEAVQRCRESDKSVASVAQEMGIAPSTLRGWCDKDKPKATKRPREENDSTTADADMHFYQPGAERVKRQRLSIDESDFAYPQLTSLTLTTDDLYWLIYAEQYHHFYNQPLDLSMKSQKYM